MKKLRLNTYSMVCRTFCKRQCSMLKGDDYCSAILVELRTTNAIYTCLQNDILVALRGLKNDKKCEKRLSVLHMLKQTSFQDFVTWKYWKWKKNKVDFKSLECYGGLSDLCDKFVFRTSFALALLESSKSNVKDSTFCQKSAISIINDFGATATFLSNYCVSCVPALRFANNDTRTILIDSKVHGLRCIKNWNFILVRKKHNAGCCPRV